MVYVILKSCNCRHKVFIGLYKNLTILRNLFFYQDSYKNLRYTVELHNLKETSTIRWEIIINSYSLVTVFKSTLKYNQEIFAKLWVVTNWWEEILTTPGSFLITDVFAVFHLTRKPSVSWFSFYSHKLYDPHVQNYNIYCTLWMGRVKKKSFFFKSSLIFIGTII